MNGNILDQKADLSLTLPQPNNIDLDLWPVQLLSLFDIENLKKAWIFAKQV